MNSKRIFSILLSAIILVQTLTACSSSSDSGKVSTDAETSAAAQETTEDVTEDEYKYLTDIGKRCSDGAVITFAAINDGTVDSILNDISVESENGVLLNDVIYQRNRRIEEKLGAKIVCDGFDERNDLTSAVKRDVLSADGRYDVVDANTCEMPVLFTNECLLDFAEIPNLSLDKEWWNQSANESFSVAGKNYVLISSLNHFADAVVWGVMFNKYMFDGYNLTYPYQMVNDGTWTIDAMTEMMKSVPLDSNGSGGTDSGDIFGCMAQPFDAAALVTSFNCKYFTKDENDIPQFTLASESNVTKFNKIFDLFADKTATCNVNDYKSEFENVWNDLWVNSFVNDRALFMFNAIVNLMDFTDMDHDYGFLPMPKYDEAQSDYHTMTSMWYTSSLAIPVSHSSAAEDIGLVLEGLSYLSYMDVDKAYYDTYLTNRYIRDEESSQMMNIIINTKTFDVGFMFDWGTAMQLPQQIITSGKNTFASTIAKKESSVVGAMNKTVSIITGNP